MGVKLLFDAWRDYISLRTEPQIEEWFDRFDWRLIERDLPATPLHATRHIPDCKEHAGRGEMRLVDEVIAHSSQLNWIQMYEPGELGQHFTDNYAHVELIGTRGHFASEEIAGGIVLYGPQVDYLDHWHTSEEIYIPLTGNGSWSKDGDDYVVRNSGEFIFHESNMHHSMKAQDTPLLALWIWKGGDLKQKVEY